MFRDFLAGRAPIKPVYQNDSGFLGFIGLRSVKTHVIVIWMLLASNIILSLMDNMTQTGRTNWTSQQRGPARTLGSQCPPFFSGHVALGRSPI